MREILFRGKVLEEVTDDDAKVRHCKGDWIYGSLITGDGRTWIVIDMLSPEVEIVNVVWWCEVDPGTVGQYTGRRDKADNEIWEHDVLYDDFWEKLGDVSYDAEDAAFIVVFDRDENWFLGDVDSKDIRVVGNIHDNLDLLEGGE